MVLSRRSPGKMVSWIPVSHVLLVAVLLLTGMASPVASVAKESKGCDGGGCGKAGQSIQIPCLDQAYKAISTVEWEDRDKKTIGKWISSQGMTMQPEFSTRFRISEQDYSLTISDLRVDDSGTYTCRMSRMNETIDVQKAQVITIKDKPSPPLDVSLKAVSADAVLATWKAPLKENNSNVTRYVVRLIENKHDWNTASEYRVFGSQNPPTSSRLANLKPYKEYVAQVLAVNDIGSSEPSVDSNVVRTHEAKPERPPTINKTYNISSTSIGISWSPPAKDHINGVLTGYNISYFVDRKVIQQIPPPPPPNHIVVNGSIDKRSESFNLTGLQPFKNYTIFVSVLNKAGEGPSAPVRVQTDEGVPTKPRIIDATDQTSSSLKVKWERPNVANGIIVKYEVFWSHSGKNDSRTITGDDKLETIIYHLEAYTLYQLIVAAYTRKGMGEKSTSFQALSDVKGPSKPLNVSISDNDTSIEISWKRPEKFCKQIDKYYITLQADTSTDEGLLENEHTLDQPDLVARENLNYYIDDLRPGTEYTVKICGATTSLFHDKRDYKGAYSDPAKIVIRGGQGNKDNSRFTAGVVGGIVTILILLIIAVVLFIVYRRYKVYRYLDQRDPEIQPTPAVILDDYDPNESHTVTVADFSDHVTELHRDSDLGFSQEFEEIFRNTRTDLTFDHSMDPENKHKNRYVNINAYDHSRCILRQVSGKQKHMDYINANFVDGYHKNRAYIATQGPLPSTIADFWRMVWEQNSSVIVMITNLVEKGRVKCDQYWPNEGTETYGLFQVKLLNTHTMAHYTVRVFTIRHCKARRVNVQRTSGPNKRHHQGERLVYQYHYTDWPDHGVPDYTLPVLTLVRKSSQMASTSESGPIIIHCSAGVGRTGTYIVLDSMMKQIKDKETVNVFGFLQHIRNQRNFLVQTEEQYIFIHDALLEFIKSGGETEIKAPNLQDYITKITTLPEGEEETELTKQFKLITNYRPAQYELTFAQKSVNSPKNRSQNLVPVNSKRVILPAQPGVDGSDYINASYLHGYNDKKEYIVTQHPLVETQQDFWRMVWDQNSNTVVLLSTVEEKEYDQFWPKADEPLDCHNFNVCLTEEHHHISQTARDFMLESKQDDYELMIRIISCCEWPKNCEPVNTAFELVKSVKTWYSDHHSGPIVVIDKLGGAAAATFCALSTLYDEFQQDDVVDVYQLARLYYLQRQGIFNEEGEYEFLYKAIASISHDPPERKDSFSSGNNQTVTNSIHNSHSHNQHLHVHGGSVHLRDKKGERPPRPETTI
ncbi:tyrosine-protein phosphatase 99A-like isoform X2 [Lineus longissimus]|uniref:tyrosine-protein phosphatase 99A-like isoform X2 n=1 Tax=Lineus longissimus TaxID=88925 RepID=UPI00315D6074